MRLLILGGTTEATALCRALAGRNDVAPILSLAGRTSNPVLPAMAHRIGGFGGPDGLAHYLGHERIAAVVDATHPFAARISAQAATVCAALGLPLVAYTRPPWTPRDGDRWAPVADLAAAAAALDGPPRRVLLTVGRLGVGQFRSAPQHRYLIRTIEPPDPDELPPNHATLVARGPFSRAEEETLMRRERIDLLVTKNSGGAATAAKLDVARRLGLPVVMVERPPRQATRPEVYELAAVLDWIAAHRSPPDFPEPGDHDRP